MLKITLLLLSHFPFAFIYILFIVLLVYYISFSVNYTAFCVKPSYLYDTYEALYDKCS